MYSEGQGDTIMHCGESLKSYGLLLSSYLFDYIVKISIIIQLTI